MKPYYEHAGITIYHGDCREILPQLPKAWCVTCSCELADESILAIHLAAGHKLEPFAAVMVTDPPYGMAYQSGWSDRSVTGDEDSGVRNQILAMWKGPAVVFGRWSIDRPSGSRVVLIWDKGEWPGMGDLSFPWGLSHEEIYVIGEGFKGRRMGTVLRRDRIGGAGDHPTEKPVSVLQKLIERCPDGAVLDPFAGICTTLKAAKDLNRRAIGIEIEEKYCEIAARRLSQEVFSFGG
jgi:DNA modification methylase